MPGQTMATAEIEPVEPQSLKKLNLKSLNRALDFFSPARAHPVPPNPDRTDSEEIAEGIEEKSC